MGVREEASEVITKSHQEPFEGASVVCVEDLLGAALGASFDVGVGSGDIVVGHLFLGCRAWGCVVISLLG